LGRRGDDVLNGGEGRDRLIGGGGADTFVIGIGTERDVIRDFRFRQGDRIALANNLTFDDLTIEPFRDRGVRLSVDGERLANLRPVRVDTMTEAAFIDYQG
ncbi:MAG: hypothetical protein AB4042_01885, partial [Leptolyngbyaceae cyanobacterium]